MSASKGIEIGEVVSCVSYGEQGLSSERVDSTGRRTGTQDRVEPNQRLKQKKPSILCLSLQEDTRAAR